MSDVTAIVVGGDPALAPPRGDLAETVCIAGLGDVAGAAATARTPLVWLVDARARAFEETLPALLVHAGGPAVSLPVDVAGRPVEAAIGRFTEDDAERMIECVARGTVPLAHTPVISLLADRDLVAGLAPPDAEGLGAHAGTAWSVRLLAARPGVLVTDSRIQVRGPRRGALVHALRLSRSGTLSRRDSAAAVARSFRGTTGR